jgi:hypothetical protein
MKTLTFLSLAAAACMLVGCGSVSRQSSTESGRPVRLQVSVDLPAGMNMLRDEEIAEAFAYRVATALHEQGFRGRIQYVSDADRPLADVPLLEVSLREWRVDRMGNVDCTFTARLNTASGRQNLGLFTGTSMMTWRRHDWLARADGFEEAAGDALSNLASRLDKTGMLAR